MADAPNKSKRWTDTDDFVADIFPPRKAAELLGRTYLGVIARRNEKGLGRPHGSKKPRKQLRREYFATGQGPREELVPPPPMKCRYCERKPTRRGLCKKCYRWVQRLVEAGVVTWELAEWLWLGGRRSGAS